MINKLTANTEPLMHTGTQIKKTSTSINPYEMFFCSKDKKEENKKVKKSKSIGTKLFIGGGIATGFFLVDLFAAKGKILSTITGGKVSFIKTMSEEIDNVLKKDSYATKSRLDAFLSVPGLHAIWGHRVVHKFHEWKIPVVPRLLSNISRFFTGIEIHPGAKMGKNIFIDHTGAIIGETAEVGNNVEIIGRVVLGSTGKDGFLRHTIVEDNVTIGMNSVMLGRIRLKKGSKIGAGAVVTHDVPEGVTVVGNPAKIISIGDKRLTSPIPIGKNSMEAIIKVMNAD